MGACSPSCGWCGRCTAAWEAYAEPEHIKWCAECGKDVFGGVTIAGMGTYCSLACAQKDEADRSARVESKQDPRRI